MVVEWHTGNSKGMTLFFKLSKHMIRDFFFLSLSRSIILKSHSYMDYTARNKKEKSFLKRTSILKMNVIFLLPGNKGAMRPH